MAKIITLVSPIGAFGKSTLCVSLAHALALMEKRVLLVDLSPHSPSLSSLLSLSESVVYTVFDIVDGAADAKTVILPAPEKKGKGEWQRIALAPILPSFSASAEGVAEAVTALAKEYQADFVIIDASLEMYPSLAAVSDERILLTDARESSLLAAEALSYHYAQENPFTYFVLKSSLVYERIVKTEPLLDVIDRLSVSLLGVLPVSSLLSDKGLLTEKKDARLPYARAVKNIAARICGESVPLLRGVALQGISRRAFIERCTKDKT